MNNRGVFWGVFLVLLGVVYLLRQFGLIYFHITWLFAWRLWPVLLIIAGLRLILPRTGNLAGSLILLVMVALFAYVIYEGYEMKKEGRSFQGREFDGHGSDPGDRGANNGNDSDSDSDGDGAGAGDSDNDGAGRQDPAKPDNDDDDKPDPAGTPDARTKPGLPLMPGTQIGSQIGLLAWI